jgi:hypothetical protein
MCIDVGVPLLHPVGIKLGNNLMEVRDARHCA